MGLPRVQLPDGAKRGHPWIYASHDDNAYAGMAVGQGVEVVDAKGQTLGFGLVDPHATIAVRIYDRRAPVDAEYFRRRLVHCIDQRRPLLKITDAMRILHGENDGIPAVVLDRYGAYGVLKLYSAALVPWVATLTTVLRELELFEGVYLRWSRRLKQDEGVLFGDVPELIDIQEHGMRFGVDVRRGQKTGFFIDQRDGRALARANAKGLSVLNCFAYSGGFSVAAIAGGAEHVVSVDSSPGAMAACAAHVQRNAPSETHRHEAVVADVWDYLRRCNERFGLIVLDPPALTTDKKSLPKAQSAYLSLHDAALKRLRPGGLLLTCSCSSRVTEDMFMSVVQDAGRAANRTLTLLQALKQPPDHPTRKQFPEGQYLKVLLYRSS